MRTHNPFFCAKWSALSACRFLIPLCVAAFIAPPAFAALNDTNVLVIYNSQVNDSQEVYDYYRTRPGRGSVYGLNLNDATLTGGTISYADYISKIRNPLRTHLTNNGLETQIIVFVLTKGIPHRIQALTAPVDVGDIPLQSETKLEAGNATFASVDSELTLLWQDLETGEADGSYDSNADNAVRNPYFAQTVSMTTFTRGGFFGVTQTKSFSRGMDDIVWTMRDPTLLGPQSSNGGDIYLTARLDGNSLQAVKDLIDRGQSAVYDKATDLIIQDKTPSGTFEGSDYDNAAALVADNWPTFDYDQTSDFLIGSASDLADASAPVRKVSGNVAVLTGYGGNHDGFSQSGYIATYTGQLISGAIFSTYESYNGKDFNGVGGFGDQGQLSQWVDAGGTFGMGHVWEPFTFAVPRNERFLNGFFYQGLTWVEAAWSSIQVISWQNLVLGDPLAVAVVDQTPIAVVSSSESLDEFVPGQTAEVTVTMFPPQPAITTVNIDLGGSATLDSDYSSPATATVEVAANQASASFDLSVLPDELAEGTESVTIDPLTGTGYRPGAGTTVNIADKPIGAWLFDNFGSQANDPIAALDNDPDEDGLDTLGEFAFNLDPLEEDATTLTIGDLASRGQPAVTIEEDMPGENYLVFEFDRRIDPSGITYTPESSTDLTSFSPVGTYLAQDGAPVPTGDGVTERVRYKSIVPLADPTAPERLFLQVEINQSP